MFEAIHMVFFPFFSFCYPFFFGPTSAPVFMKNTSFVSSQSWNTVGLSHTVAEVVTGTAFRHVMHEVGSDSSPPGLITTETEDELVLAVYPELY